MFLARWFGGLLSSVKCTVLFWCDMNPVTQCILPVVYPEEMDIAVWAWSSWTLVSISTCSTSNPGSTNSLSLIAFSSYPHALVDSQLALALLKHGLTCSDLESILARRSTGRWNLNIASCYYPLVFLLLNVLPTWGPPCSIVPNISTDLFSSVSCSHSHFGLSSASCPCLLGSNFLQSRWHCSPVLYMPLVLFSLEILGLSSWGHRSCVRRVCHVLELIQFFASGLHVWCWCGSWFSWCLELFWDVSSLLPDQLWDPGDMDTFCSNPWCQTSTWALCKAAEVVPEFELELTHCSYFANGA